MNCPIQEYIRSCEIKLTSFKVLRAADSGALKLIPNEWISDYHLDSHVMNFYKDDKEMASIWIGENRFNYELDKVFSVEDLSQTYLKFLT